MARQVIGAVLIYLGVPVFLWVGVGQLSASDPNGYFNVTIGIVLSIIGAYLLFSNGHYLCKVFGHALVYPYRKGDACGRCGKVLEQDNGR